MAQKLLEVTDLVCGYDDGVVLENLSFHISPGERVAILGRNGVGKSTMLKTIMGLVATKSGTITLANENIARMRPHKVAKSGIGYVPQGREIFRDFTVEENLQLGNLATNNFDDIYALFPVLKKRAQSKAGSFSGGQQQQLAIARALVGYPQLMLLDEPSEGVQPSIVTEIGQTLVQMSEQSGTAILLVEQNIEMVLQTCQRCMFIDDGRICATHTSEHLKDYPEIFDEFMGL